MCRKRLVSSPAAKPGVRRGGLPAHKQFLFHHHKLPRLNEAIRCGAEEKYALRQIAGRESKLARARLAAREGSSEYIVDLVAYGLRLRRSGLCEEDGEGVAGGIILPCEVIQS